MLIEGVSIWFTVSFMVFVEVTVEGDAQVAVEVIIQLTLSLFFKALEAKVALFVPAVTPFNFQT
jgi:hypothetical protein